MESPHVLFAKWINSLVSGNKEVAQKRAEAGEEIRVRFMTDEISETFHTACEQALAKDRK